MVTIPLKYKYSQAKQFNSCCQVCHLTVTLKRKSVPTHMPSVLVDPFPVNADILTLELR